MLLAKLHKAFIFLCNPNVKSLLPARSDVAMWLNEWYSQSEHVPGFRCDIMLPKRAGVPLVCHHLLVYYCLYYFIFIDTRPASSHVHSLIHGISFQPFMAQEEEAQTCLRLFLLPLCCGRLLTVLLQWEAGTGERCQTAEPDKPINQHQDTADWCKTCL